MANIAANIRRRMAEGSENFPTLAMAKRASRNSKETGKSDPEKIIDNCDTYVLESKINNLEPHKGQKEASTHPNEE